MGIELYPELGTAHLQQPIGIDATGKDVFWDESVRRFQCDKARAMRLAGRSSIPLPMSGVSIVEHSPAVLGNIVEAFPLFHD